MPLFKHDLRKELAKWVKKNFGAEFVEEALDKYDKINSGIPIGGFSETVVFLHMVETIKAELEGRRLVLCRRKEKKEVKNER